MSDQPRDEVGRVVGGRWRVLRRAGTGGEATVWVAERTLGDPVHAVLKVRHDRDPETRARIAREWAIASGVKHPRLLTALDHGDDPVLGPWVAFEVLGRSAWDELETGGPMGAPAAAEVVRQLLDGLSALHAAGVVHRDVKPQNLLRDPATGGWKLADFGIAHLQGNGGLTDTATTMGTWAWSAPEQRYSARSVTPASDVYAAGATLYALLRGRAPFELHALSARDAVWQDVPGPLAAVILRATRLDPAERYPTAEAMRDALTQYPPKVPPKAWALGGAVLASLGMAWLAREPAQAPEAVAPVKYSATVLAPEATIEGAPASHEGLSGAILLFEGPEPDSRAGSALLAWSDPDIPGEPRLAVGAPRAGKGGRVYWVPDRRPGYGTGTRTLGQDFGAALSQLQPLSSNPRTFIAVGGPALDGHVYFFDPVDPNPLGWVFLDTEALGPSASGASLADLGDFYGTGRAALAFGAPAAGADGRGAARLHHLEGKNQDVARLWGEAPQTALGTSMVAVDSEGDGLRELYTGAPGGDAGAVWRVGPYTRGEGPIRNVAEGVLRGPGGGDRLGMALAPAGDVDGDGYPELWVGAPGAWSDAGQTGRVYLLSAHWEEEVPVEALARAVLGGAVPGGDFGAVLAGDSGSESLPVGVAVSALGEGDGVVRVYDADLWGEVVPEQARATWIGAMPGGQFGAALLLDVDLNGDGFEELIVGAPGERNGRVWMMGGG